MTLTEILVALGIVVLLALAFLAWCFARMRTRAEQQEEEWQNKEIK